MYFDLNGGVLATSDRFHCGNQSNFGWNPCQNKIAAGREIVPVAIHKSTQKKENNAFGFCIIQISQSYCFYLTIYVFTEMCRIQKKERKSSYETYSFVWICDRSNRNCKGGNYRFLVIVIKNVYLSLLLLRTPSSRVILTSPEILRPFLDRFCTGPFSVSLDLSSSLI